MDNQTVSLTASNIRYLLAVKQLTDQGARVRCVDALWASLKKTPRGSGA